MSNSKDNISKFKEGDETVFYNLVEELKQQVFNTCFGFVRNTQEAEDLTQDTFIKAFQKRDKFKGDSSLKTWIYRIAVNTSLEYLRSKNRDKRKWFNNALSLDDIQEKINCIDAPDKTLEEKELEATLNIALGKLPDNQKAVFVMSKIDGYSNKEISEILEISISSIESLSFRAKKNLQKILEKFYKKHYK